MEFMSNIPINALDVGVVLVSLFTMMLGLRNGLSKELARVIGLVVAIIAGFYFYEILAQVIQRQTELSQKTALTISLIICILAGAIILGCLRFVLAKILEFGFKGPLERIGGMIAGLVRGLVFCTAILFLLGLVPHEGLHRQVTELSVAGKAVTSYLPDAYNKYAQELPEIFPDTKKEESADELLNRLQKEKSSEEEYGEDYTENSN